MQHLPLFYTILHWYRYTDQLSQLYSFVKRQFNKTLLQGTCILCLGFILFVFLFFFPSVPNVLNFFKKFHVAQSVVKNPPANAVDTGDLGSIPELGRSLGGGNGNPLQYSCLKNPMGWGAWQATVHGVAENQD